MILGNVRLPGIVLENSAVGEFDRRVVILTKERGRITAFAKNARKPKSPFLACTQPFTYAEFEVYASRDAYRLEGVENVKFFEGLREDLETVFYASFFCETAGFYSRENNDDSELFKLLYVSLLALSNGKTNRRLIAAVYEWRAFFTNGVGMNVFCCAACRSEKNLKVINIKHGSMLCADCAGVENNALRDTKSISENRQSGQDGSDGRRTLSAAVVYALQYAASAPYGSLFSFNVTDSVLDEFTDVVASYRSNVYDRPLKSLEALSDFLEMGL